MSPINGPAAAIVTKTNYRPAVPISRICGITIGGSCIAIAICRIRRIRRISRVSPVSISRPVTVTGANTHTDTETHARLGRSRSDENHESQRRNYRKSNLFKHCFPPHSIGRGLFLHKYGATH